MRRALFVACLLMLGSAVLGATVLREPFAWAATPFQNVIVSNDASKPVPVREQTPSAPWFAHKILIEEVFEASRAFIAGPSSVAINLTSLSIGPNPDVFGQPAEPAAMFLIPTYVPDSATACNAEDLGERAWAMNSIPAPLAIAFPTPLQIAVPSGKKVCLLASLFGGSEGMSVNASGFYG